jgi:anti-anti-sigma factor
MADESPASGESVTASSSFVVRTVERDGVVIVSMAGELDMATVAEAAAALQAATAHDLPVVLDLTELRFFSSAGLSLLMWLHRASADVRLAGDHRIVRRPLELTGLLDLFPIYASVAEAMAASVH